MDSSLGLPIFLINLERSPERRQRMRLSLGKLGINFEIFPAIDGNLLSSETLGKSYNPGEAFSKLGRALHLNEVGCCLSHMGIWQKMVEEKLPEVLILEDDITILPGFHSILARRREWLPQKWAVVNLAHDIATPLPLYQISGDFEEPIYHFCTFEGIVSRTSAYLVSFEGARSLLEHVLPIRMPVDDLTGNPLYLNATVYGVTPKLAVWDDEIPSDIWTDQNMDEFTKASRNSFSGIFLRLLRRLRGKTLIGEKNREERSPK